MRPVLDTMDTDALPRRFEGTGLLSNADAPALAGVGPATNTYG